MDKQFFQANKVPSNEEKAGLLLQLIQLKKENIKPEIVAQLSSRALDLARSAAQPEQALKAILPQLHEIIKDLQNRKENLTQVIEQLQQQLEELENAMIPTRSYS